LNCHDLCKDILALDNAIRFAGIASMKGKILAAEYRREVEHLLTPQESEMSIIQSLIRMGTRRTLEEKLGKTIYAFASYQKVKRASIMTYAESGGIDDVVMVSFDREANHDSIIMEKIMPYLRKAGKQTAD
jgi:hypothetical protein